MTESFTLSNTPARRWLLGSWATLAHALGLVVVKILLWGVVAFSLLNPLLMRGAEWFQGSPNEIFACFLLVVLAVGFVHWGIVRTSRLSWGALGWNRIQLGRDMALGAACFPVQLGIVAVTYTLLGSSISELGSTIADFSVWQRLEFGLIGVQVAIAEETLFRGYLQPSLCARMSPALGILLTAVIFSAYHVHGPIEAFANRVVVGVIWGVLRYRTGRLVAPATAHFLNWFIIGPN